ncbi:hypothetical protein [Candidatus Uabimicrobium sp. HlEnr_7]|uniref:hypothetical protein n=1 Tax=Candidatus Uabimicrobium helgolandensis TaxID=3095367 RepID=UPI003558DF2E
MILKITNNKKANALITVLAVLFVVSTMAVSFARIAGNERAASVNFTEAFKARMLSEAGISFAVSKLRRDFEGQFFSLPQGFGKQDDEPIGERRWTYSSLKPLASTAEAPDDDTGAGIPLEELQNISSGNTIFGDNENRVFADLDNPQMITPHLSYADLDQGTNLPKTVLNRLVVSHTEKTLPNGVVPAYSLKIFSLDAQLDLNSQIPDNDQVATDLNLVNMLENLSRAIALREPYFSKFVQGQGALDAAGNGPLFSTERDEFIAKDILALRQQLAGGTFKTKYQITNIPGIDKRRLPYLWDFISANPFQEGTISRPVDANLTAVNPGDPELEQYRDDSRAAVNVNLASWPVLVSVFAGLECLHHEGDTVSISFDEAKALANRICDVRREKLFEESDSDDVKEAAMEKYPLSTWEKFKRFLLTTDTSGNRGAFDIFTGDATAKLRKALLVYAMADPNVHLRRTNPDLLLYQDINKTDITKVTTELTFHVQGLFEVTSLGQLIDIQGNVIQSHKRQTVCRIFSSQVKSTQSELHNEQVLVSLPSVVVNNFQQVNGYSSGNNLNNIDVVNEDSVSDNVSEQFGHVTPVSFDLNYLETDGQIATFSKDDVDGGSVVFRANYNGASAIDVASTPEDTALELTLNADHAVGDHKQKDPVTLADPDDATSDLLSEKVAGIMFPKASESGDKNNIGDLASDGVIFHENPDDEADGLPKEDETLCYLSEDNMPLPDTVEEMATSDESDGTVSFWFKLNKNKSWSKFRTVFFATTPFTNNGTSDGGNSLDGLKGVQMEIQMKYSESDGRIAIQARRKFYDLQPGVRRADGTLENDRPEPDSGDIYSAPSPDGVYDVDNLPAFIGSSRQASFSGVEEHKWYNLAVSWKDTTNLDIDNSIKLFGENTDHLGSDDTVPDRLFELENPVESSETEGQLANIPRSEVSVDLFVADDSDAGSSVNQELSEKLKIIERTEENSRSNARMFFGSVLRSFVGEDGATFNTHIYSSAMTIDDIRIAKGAIGDAGGPGAGPFLITRVAPTGFVNGENNVMGLFSGKFPQLDANRTRLGRFMFTIRKSEDAIDPAAFVENQDSFSFDEPVDEEEFENASTNSEYITSYTPGEKRKPKFIKSGKTKGVDNDAVKVLREFILGEDNGVDFFGREISNKEFEKLFLSDLKKKWREVWDELDMDNNLRRGFSRKNFEKLEKIKDKRIFIFKINAGQRMIFFLNRHEEFRNGFIGEINALKEEIRGELSGGNEESEESEENEESEVQAPPVVNGSVEPVVVLAQKALGQVNLEAQAAGKVGVEAGKAERLIAEAAEAQGVEPEIDEDGEPAGAGSSAGEQIPNFEFDGSSSIGEDGDVIVTPEGAEFNFNILFEQEEDKITFDAPVIDDVTITYQTKLLFFYNIELFD